MWSCIYLELGRKKMKMDSPTLLLDEQKALTNLNKISAKLEGTKVDFRPHFKTHQSRGIANWFRRKNVVKIAVSSLKMAEYFAADNWEDITVAFPCNILEIDRINALASKIQLNLLVESKEVVQFLTKRLQSKVGIFIKIDTGYNRTGILSSEVEKIDALIAMCRQTELLNFRGFLSHFGHTYKVQGITAIRQIFDESNAQLSILKSRYKKQYPNLEISIGDTPSCSVMNDFGVATEIRPGNFIFYDLMQWQIGSCTKEEIAVALACPVVAKHEERLEIIVHGGGVHLSKERAIHPETKEVYYGLAYPLSGKGWDLNAVPSIVKSLSQEHGIIKATPYFFDNTKVGDVIAILPIHSCMTANLMKSYRTLDGAGIGMMPWYP